MTDSQKIYQINADTRYQRLWHQLSPNGKRTALELLTDEVFTFGPQYIIDTFEVVLEQERIPARLQYA